MNFSKRISTIVIVFFVTIFICNHTFGMEAVDVEEKFQFLRLAANPEKVNSSDEMLFPIVTDCDKQYSDEMLHWHREATEELKALDPQVNHSVDRNRNRNLCSLQISVVYNVKGVRTKRSVIFRDDLFLSGSDLSAIKPQSFALGQVELCNNPFTITLEPGHRGDRLPNLTAETEKTFHCALAHSDQAEKLPLKLKKRFVSLDEFFPGPFEYERHIIDYFGFSSVIDAEHKKEIIKAFEKLFTPTLQKSSFLNKNQIIDQSRDSLSKALIVLPFSAASNDKALKLFGETADTLFKVFKHNFCDSEQAIRLFIDQKADKLLGCALGIDDKDAPFNVSDIEQIYVNIASIRYMCFCCQGTYLYDINGIDDIHRRIVSAILRAQKKDLRRVEEFLKDRLVVVYTSGIKPTSKG